MVRRSALGLGSAEDTRAHTLHLRLRGVTCAYAQLSMAYHYSATRTQAARDARRSRGPLLQFCPGRRRVRCICIALLCAAMLLLPCGKSEGFQTRLIIIFIIIL